MRMLVVLGCAVVSSAISFASATAEESALDFEAVAPAVVAIPAAGEASPVALALRITAAGREAVTVPLGGEVTPALADAAGRRLPLDGGRNGTRPAPAPVVLRPGESVEIPLPASLVWTSDGRLRLIGEGPLGGVWHFDGLSPGTYRLWIEYDARATVGGSPPSWSGRATTQPQEVEIR